MPLLLLIVGAVIAIAAFNNAQGTLATELESDVPQFLTWGLAVFGVGTLGWIPGMQTVSRWLLALVMVVLVLKNYSQIIAGFQAFQGTTSSTATTTSATPATAYETNPAQPQVTLAEISGSGTIPASSSAAAANINAGAQPVYVTSPFGTYDPASFLSSFEAGFGGFGGIV